VRLDLVRFPSEIFCCLFLMTQAVVFMRSEQLRLNGRRSRNLCKSNTAIAFEMALGAGRAFSRPAPHIIVFATKAESHAAAALRQRPSFAHEHAATVGRHKSHNVPPGMRVGPRALATGNVFGTRLILVSLLIAYDLLRVGRATGFWSGLMRSTAAACSRVVLRVALLGDCERRGSKRDPDSKAERFHSDHLVDSYPTPTPRQRRRNSRVSQLRFV
jgi:hypothetical protein